MKIFLITLSLTVGVVLLCALFLGSGRLLKSKKPLSCKKCGNPEDDCKVCGKKKPASKDK
ncbi:MAG: hypothetical protein AB7N99_00865 [Simkaniaceae bacterium]